MQRWGPEGHLRRLPQEVDQKTYGQVAPRQEAKYLDNMSGGIGVVGDVAVAFEANRCYRSSG